MNEEEVKKILSLFKTTDDWDMAIQQICQLFPPYRDAQWSDEEGQCFWCKIPTHWVDICYEGYVCSQKCQQEIAQDVKLRSEPELYLDSPLDKLSKPDDKRIYPCDDCGELRSKNEGGTTFTVCDECWDKSHGESKPEGVKAIKPTRLQKPDDRLLIRGEILEQIKRNTGKGGTVMYYATESGIVRLLRKQKEMTASIIREEKDAECSKKIEEIFQLLIDQGILCSEAGASEYNCPACKLFWQALIKKESDDLYR